jgi:hypothetical protein
MGKYDNLAAMADEAGDAVRQVIAGYLPYNPGPGIYSRLERAVEAMPENVRVQELPGLIKRYKDGVPGWELKATDLDSIIDGRDLVPREEILARVKERSPVYTHKEVVLADDVPVIRERGYAPVPGGDGLTYMADRVLDYQDEASRLGAGRAHGDPKYATYGQGGDRYTEILLTQPGARAGEYGNHWRRAATSSTDAAEDAVAHARSDTHGDALRINELQSDLGIHNRKVREATAREEAMGPEAGAHYRNTEGSELPFPLEDAWSDLLIKRLALEAARKGHRAIEVASPRAIADKVGGNIENYEHFYGKVVPGALERLGRKMGGLSPDDSGAPAARLTEESPQYAYNQTFRDQMQAATGQEGLGPNFWRLYSGMRYDSLPPSQQAITYDRFGGSHPVSQAEGGAPQEMYDYLHGLGLPPEQAQRITSQAMYLAPHNARDMHSLAVREQLESVGRLTRQPVSDNPRRYIMSDEMRRRIIEGGIGASLLAPLASQYGEE